MWASFFGSDTTATIDKPISAQYNKKDQTITLTLNTYINSYSVSAGSADITEEATHSSTTYATAAQENLARELSEQPSLSHVNIKITCSKKFIKLDSAFFETFFAEITRNMTITKGKISAIEINYTDLGIPEDGRIETLLSTIKTNKNSNLGETCTISFTNVPASMQSTLTAWGFSTTGTISPFYASASAIATASGGASVDSTATTTPLVAKSAPEAHYCRCC